MEARKRTPTKNIEIVFFLKILYGLQCSQLFIIIDRMQPEAHGGVLMLFYLNIDPSRLNNAHTINTINATMSSILSRSHTISAPRSFQLYSKTVKINYLHDRIGVLDALCWLCTPAG